LIIRPRDREGTPRAKRNFQDLKVQASEQISAQARRRSSPPLLIEPGAGFTTGVMPQPRGTTPSDSAAPRISEHPK